MRLPIHRWRSVWGVLGWCIPNRRRRRARRRKPHGVRRLASEALEPIVVFDGDPIANDDEYSLAFGGTLQASTFETSVVADDLHGDGTSWDPNDAYEASLVTSPAHGSLTFQPNGTFTYVPGAGFSGTDGFTYAVTDAFGTSAAATVTIEVGANHAPEATPGAGAEPGFPSIDRYAFDDVGAAVAELVDVGAYGAVMSDADGHALGLAVVAADQASGTWQYTLDGATWNDLGSVSDASARVLGAEPGTRLRFVPQAGFTGTAAIAFRLWDRTDGAASGAVVDCSPHGGSTAYSAATLAPSVTVFNVSGPTSVDDEYVVGFNGTLDTQTLSASLVDNDRHGNGAAWRADRPYVVTLVGGPAFGTIDLRGDGVFTYRPNIGFSGDDSFTYVVTDVVGVSAAATVVVHVTAADAPVATIVDEPASNESSGRLDFTIQLDRASSEVVTVDWAVEGLTAGRSGDFFVGAFEPGHTVDTWGWLPNPGDPTTSIWGIVASEWVPDRWVDVGTSSGSLEFEAGQTQRTVSIRLVEDGLDEPNETLRLRLTGVSGGYLGAEHLRTGTIVDGDAPPQVSVESAEEIVRENAAGGLVRLRFTLDVPSALPVAVRWSSASGTAAAGEDFASASGVVTFAPGETERTIDVAGLLVNDAVNEGTETIRIVLSEPQNVRLGGEGVVVVRDDDRPVLSIGDRTVDESSGSAVFTVSLSQATYLPVQFTWRTVGGSATAGSDYLAVAAQTVTIAPGTTFAVITVPLSADERDEDDERFRVEITSSTNVYVDDADALGTIVDDDAPPTAAVEGAMLLEGASSVTLTLRLSGPSDKPVGVRWTTAAGTATPGTDYVATFVPGHYEDDRDEQGNVIVDGSGNPQQHWVDDAWQERSQWVWFAPGETQKSLTIGLSDDDVYEGDETFEVVLSEPENVQLGAAGVVVLADDEGPNHAPTGAADRFSTGRNEPLRIVVADLTGNDTDLEGDALSWELAAPPAHGSFALDVFGNLLRDEFGNLLYTPDQDFIGRDTFTYRPFDGTDYGAETTVTIDVGPRVSIEPAASTVGEAQGVVELTVRLSRPANETVVVSWELTSDNGRAVPGEDFQVWIAAHERNLYDDVGYVVGSEWVEAGWNDARSGRVVSFAPGETIQTLRIRLVDDDLLEPTETIGIRLTGADAACVDAAGDSPIDRTTARLTLLDDDRPQLSLGGQSSRESGVQHFYVNLTDGLLGTFAATWTFDAEHSTAVQGRDFEFVRWVVSGEVRGHHDDEGVWIEETVDTSHWEAYAVVPGAANVEHFAPQERQRRISYRVLEDSAYERNETIRITIAEDHPDVALQTGDAAATGVIVNDDAAPTARIGNVTIVEGSSGTTTALVEVRLSGATELPSTVGWRTRADSATSSDFAGAAGTISFGDGSGGASDFLRTISISVVADATDEFDERFFVQLFDGVDLRLISGKTLGAVTIADDDAPPRIVISGSQTLAETATEATLTIGLRDEFGNPAAVEKEVRLNYYTVSESAQAGADYEPQVRTLILPAGATEAVVRIRLLNDRFDEPDERFLVRFTGFSGALAPLGAIDGTFDVAVTLTDDDPAEAIAGGLGPIGGGGGNGGGGGGGNPGGPPEPPPEPEPTYSVIDVGQLRASDPVTVEEGNSGAVTIRLLSPLEYDAYLRWETVDGAPGASRAAEANPGGGRPSDYVAASGVVLFAAGSTQQTIFVESLEDDWGEREEVVGLKFTALDGPTRQAGGHRTFAALKIAENDKPTMGFESDAEAEEGDGLMAFNVLLSNPAEYTVTATAVRAANSPDTATWSDDYFFLATPVLVAPGFTGQSFYVNVVQDNWNEWDQEFFRLQLTVAARREDASRYGVRSRHDRRRRALLRPGGPRCRRQRSGRKRSGNDRTGRAVRRRLFRVPDHAPRHDGQSRLERTDASGGEIQEGRDGSIRRHHDHRRRQGGVEADRRRPRVLRRMVRRRGRDGPQSARSRPAIRQAVGHRHHRGRRKADAHAVRRARRDRNLCTHELEGELRTLAARGRSCGGDRPRRRRAVQGQRSQSRNSRGVSSGVQRSATEGHRAARHRRLGREVPKQRPLSREGGRYERHDRGEGRTARRRQRRLHDPHRIVGGVPRR